MENNVSDPTVAAPDLTPNSSIKEEIDRVVDSNTSLTPQQRESQKKAFIAVFQENKTFQEALGLNDELIESVYNHAYHLYTSGKYVEAKAFFEILVRFNPEKSKFWIGRGMCFEKLDRWSEALLPFTFAYIKDHNNPTPFYHIAQCLTHLNQIDQAIEYLHNALRVAGDQKEYAVFKERIQMLLNSLEEKGKEKAA